MPASISSAESGKTSAASSGPPAFAFQSLPLSSKRRSHHSSGSRRRKGNKSGKETRIVDPLEQLETDSFSHSESNRSNEASSTVSGTVSTSSTLPPVKSISVPSLFDHIEKAWIEVGSPEEVELCKACFVSFACVFYGYPQRGSRLQSSTMPLPTKSVLFGLWSQVVLPPLLFLIEEDEAKDEDDESKASRKLPELVAQDVWGILKGKLGYIQVADSSQGKETAFVGVAHDVYLDYARSLISATSKGSFTTHQIIQWKLNFWTFLKDVYFEVLEKKGPVDINGIVQYASCHLLPALLNNATSDKDDLLFRNAQLLLKNPTFGGRLWLYLRNENALQLTLRYCEWCQMYLQHLSADGFWEEALSIFQGWQGLLYQELEALLEASDPHPLNLLVLGRSMHVLAMAIDSLILTQNQGLVDVQPPPISVWKRQVEYLESSMRNYVHAANSSNGSPTLGYQNHHFYGTALMLCASSWLQLSHVIQQQQLLEMSASLFGPSDFDVLISLFGSTLERRSMLVQPESNDMIVRICRVAEFLLKEAVNKKHSSLNVHYTSLLAQAQDELGQHLYHHQKYDDCRSPLEGAVKHKRALLTLLKDQLQTVGCGVDATLSSAYLHDGGQSIILPTWDGLGPGLASTEQVKDLAGHLCLHIVPSEKVVQEAELSLSTSLEYAALALHTSDHGQQYRSALVVVGGLQEALMLKSIHQKFSLEVARLNLVLAVVHEDLMQWEAALTHTKECLRIRMHHLSQKPQEEWFSNTSTLYESILENLRTIGNTYRMLDSYDNAMGCYWKIATMCRKEWELRRDDGSINTNFFGFESRMSSLLPTAPLPTFVLDEQRYSSSRKRLQKSFENRLTDAKNMMGCGAPFVADTDQSTMDENRILRETAQSLQTIVSLFKDKVSASKRYAKHDDSQNGQLPSHQASLPMSLPFNDVPILLSCSYQLGLIHFHFRDFRSAIASLDQCLQCLWVIDPPSSESGSDSYDSQSEGESQRKRSTIRRKRLLQGRFGRDIECVEDDAVYHGLGICRAAIGEHDQAVRFHLTALRSARLEYGVNAPRVAEILSDTAASYWYIQEYERAEEFWLACARIQLGVKHSGDWLAETSSPTSLKEAQTLYKIGAARCAMGRFSDSKTRDILENAMVSCGDGTIDEANCLFYLASIHFRDALTCDKLIIISKSAKLLKAAICIYERHGILAYSEFNSAEIDPHQRALQAHIHFMEGGIADTFGKTSEALTSYSKALFLYRSLGDLHQINIASVLNTMGSLHLQRGDPLLALRRLEEALRLRQLFLGMDHIAVADTMYKMARVYTRLSRFQISMELYAEALRIYLIVEGNDSGSVATVLLEMSAVLVEQGLFSEAMDKLNGSYRIRMDRVKRMGSATQFLDLSTADIADAYEALGVGIACRSMTTSKMVKNNDHVRQALRNDAIKEERALAIVLHCIGNMHLKLDELDNAKEAYERSLFVRHKHPVTDVVSPDGEIMLHIGDTLHNLAVVYEKMQDFERALKYYAAALRLNGRTSSQQQPSVDTISDDTMIIYGEGENGNDEARLDSSYLNKKNANVSYAASLRGIAMIQFRKRNNKVAIACFDAALRIQKNQLGPMNTVVAQTLSDMAKVHQVEGRRLDAIKCCQEAFSIRKSNKTKSFSTRTGHLLYRMGTMYDLERDYARAVVCYRQAVRIYGYQYVSAASQSFLESLLLMRKGPSGNNLDDSDESLDTSGLFQLTGAISLEDKHELTQNHFGKIAALLATSYKSQAASIAQATTGKDSSGTTSTLMISLDMSSPDCLISLELYLLNLAQLLSHHSTAYHERLIAFHRHLSYDLENVSDGSILEVGQVGKGVDATTMKMLYLVQD